MSLKEAKDVPSGVSSTVPSGVQTLTYESSDDNDLTKEALTKVNEKLSNQVVQLNTEKKNFENTIIDLHKNIADLK